MPETSRNPDPMIGGPAALIPVEQLVCMPTCAPFVGPGSGPETPEAAEEREARGDPPPKPFKLPEAAAKHGGTSHATERQHATAKK